MKTLGITITIIIILISTSNAQIFNGYGFKAGMSIADQNFDYAAGFELPTNQRIGFDICMFTEWFNVPNFSMLAEIHYVQKGMIMECEYRDVNNQPIGIKKINNRVDYTSISILVKFSTETKPISAFLIIGERIDVLLGHKSPSFDILYDDFENIDIGGDFGFGVESNLISPVTTSLEFRYSPDFTNAYKTELLKVKNTSFEILLGVMF